MGVSRSQMATAGTRPVTALSGQDEPQVDFNDHSPNSAVEAAGARARPSTRTAIQSAARNILNGWRADTDRARAPTLHGETGDDCGAQRLRLVEPRRMSIKPAKESEHLRSLARCCHGLAKEISDVEMAQLFRDIGADYHRRAMRLVVMGR